MRLQAVGESTVHDGTGFLSYVFISDVISLLLTKFFRTGTQPPPRSETKRHANQPSFLLPFLPTMKNFVSVAAAAALAANGVSAHYIFQQLSLGSTTYAPFEYIRQNTNYNSPVTDLTSNDLRCNVGAQGSGTQTVAVKAGQEFTFTLDTPVYHQGPISIYLSKAPGTAGNYDGSGEWFKIKDFGPSFSGGQATWPMTGSYTYQIPSCIENGEYLLRIQSLAIHNPWPAGIPQFYISCAQINVSGGSGSYNPQTVRIPGAFKETDPGYTANIYSNFQSYTVPGPAPLTC
ncbi:glycosyl hydrolase family 61-domain-containing protein [Durotheca rogersii]|uniref:glycosyl hydrolase family 61-domain-containing protein n=1 Tax=Durotheca rogersii TaxID=419775 RepID=UPI002220C52D|nr:glycosyl hydrolase family 61-domain-containing protein [Durotheca rogersii]KAI5859934.1 glycosyl hydrolase family 61-domain-containing protein [Durotheca rogersii]